MRIEIYDDGTASIDGEPCRVVSSGKPGDRVKRFYELQRLGQAAPVVEPEPTPEPEVVDSDEPDDTQ